MKTIGMIGGMSWESSLEYYRIMNEAVKKKLGGQSSCKCLLFSVEFGEIVKLQHEGQWDRLTDIMVDAAQSLERGGSEMTVICTNTMHLMAQDIVDNTSIPLLHIVDTVGEKIQKKRLYTVGLLGTKFTMEKDFYKRHLADHYGIQVIIPGVEDRQAVHDIIYNELIQGHIRDESRTVYQQVIGRLIENGAEGVILGCTEIPLLVHQEDTAVPVFDTTRIHAEAAVEWALKTYKD